MDTALQLRLDFEKKKTLTKDEIKVKLQNSQLVQKLVRDYIEDPLFATFRIVGLSEIPFVEELSYTKKCIQYVKTNLATEEGFSCLGGVKEIVPCYNAMFLESFCRLGLGQTEEAQKALHWIENYQLFNRNETTTWPYKGVCKHGGCLGSIPCYIGIGKSVRALITYQEFTKEKDKKVESLIQKGTAYMLKHNMFKRLSNQKPISPHITDTMIPQNYALSLTDLTYIAGKRNLLSEKNCSSLLKLLKEKETAPNQWKIDYTYRYKGYVPFETKRKPSQWLSNLFSIWLENN